MISAEDSMAKTGRLIQQVLEQSILNRLIAVANAISEVRGLFGVLWQITKVDSGRGNSVDEGKRQARRLFLPHLCTFLKALPLILATVCSRVSEGKSGTSLQLSGTVRSPGLSANASSRICHPQ